MSRYDVAFLACRILALFAFFHAIKEAPISFTLLSQLGVAGGTSIGLTEISYVFALVLPGFLALCFGLLFWFQASRIAVWMASGAPARPAESAAHADQIQAMAISIAGLWFMVHAVTRGTPLGMMMFGVMGQEVIESYLFIYGGIPGLIITVGVELALGIGLFIGATGLAHLWRKLHPGRLDHADGPRE